ncbi:MAG: AEC family transporter [Clostridia bacterium]|nr:AEC family transporter [Clostridia bacterium]
MLSFTSLVNIMIILFLLLATGFIARKTGVIDEIASKRLSKLIVNIGQPMMIVYALIKIEEKTPEKTKMGFIMLGVSFAVHLFLCLFSYFASKPIRDFNEHKITEFALIFSNAGFIGFPVFGALFGDEGVFWAAFYLIGFHIFVWTWGMIILAKGRDDIRMNVRKVLLNFGTVPCFIGIALYLLSMQFFTIPQVLIDYTGYLNNLCTPISVLIVGALIATRTPKQIFCDIKMYYISLCRLVIMPICVCLIGKLCGLDANIILFTTAAAALPSATNITMFAELYDIAPGYAAQTVGVTSLFTIVTLPCIMLVADMIVKLPF